MTTSHAYNATLSLLITSWHIKKGKLFKHKLLILSFKLDSIKVVQTQLIEKLFKHKLLSLSFKHDSIKVVSF